jgi:hypothetical protein
MVAITIHQIIPDAGWFYRRLALYGVVAAATGIGVVAWAAFGPKPVGPPLPPAISIPTDQIQPFSDERDRSAPGGLPPVVCFETPSMTGHMIRTCVPSQLRGG